MKRTALATVITGLFAGLLLSSPVLADSELGEPDCQGADGTAADARAGSRARARARDGRRGPPPSLSELLDERADELDLSPERLAEIQDILAADEPEIQALHEEARAAHEAGDREAARDAMDAARDAQRLLMEELEVALTDDELTSLRDVLPPPPRAHGPGQDGEGDGPPPRHRQPG